MTNRPNDRHSAKHLMVNIGQTASYTVRASSGSIKILVRIVDVRARWNYEDYLIEPLAGEGQIWVNRSSVQIVFGSPTLEAEA